MWDSAVGWKTIEKKKPYRTPIYAQEALFLSSVVIIFTVSYEPHACTAD